ncbi:YhdP family protein [Ancylobacter sonchi]|uniref:YhdP family protein n=1 Tax=Ancylobacter sonchi TaxID=1937790 RepID=UPI001FEC4E55|nr:DUF3971 domain-containing protein [Ancylobacter sonchi]
MTRRADGRAGPVKRPRLRRVTRVCEAPRRGRRWVRVCSWSLGCMAGLFIAAFLTVYVLFSTGLVTVNVARPYVERALSERLGAGRTVSIGEIVSNGAAPGGMTLRVNDIEVRDDNGDVIASAPQAEIAMQDRLMPWMAGPKRIDLIGVKLQVWVTANGELTVSTGENAKPIHAAAAGPGASATPSSTASPSGTPNSAVVPSTPTSSGGPAAAPTSEAPPIGPIRLASLAALADGLDRGGLDGGGLSDIGLKDGTLTLRSEVSGRSWVFNDIDISLTRPAAGGMTFDLRAGGADGPWSAQATIAPMVNGRRDIDVAVRDLAPRDLMIAAGMADADLVATSPLSGEIHAQIDEHGDLVGSSGRMLVGAGELQLGKDKLGRMIIDEVALDFAFDPHARRIAIKPLAIHAGPLDLDIAADINLPQTADGVWTLHATRGKGSLGGGGPFSEKEPPFVADNIALDLHFDPKAKSLGIDSAKVTGTQGEITVGGGLELAGPAPALNLNVSTTPTSATTLKRIWPVLAAPEVRNWVHDNVVSGEVSRAEIALNAPLSSIGNSDIPLADDALRIDIVAGQGSFRVLPDLAPVTGADVRVHVTGRTAHVDVAKAGLQTPAGRKLALSEGVFDIPDTAPKTPNAKIRIALSGPAAGMAEVANLSSLRSHAAASPLDPATVSGDFQGVAQINIRLSNDIKPSDVDFAFEATLNDFSADKMVLGHDIDDADVRVFVTPQASVFRGDGKLAGAPISFDYTMPAKGDASFTLAATLDQASRDKLDLDLAGLGGTVAVKLNGTTSANGKVSADVDVDLTKARLAELVPGWSKPAGKPARLTAKLTKTEDGSKLDNLVVSGSGVNIRGVVTLDAKGVPVGADLPTFQLSDGDKASVKVEQAGSVTRITVRGEVIEARAFLKNLLEAPIAGNTDQAKPADVDIDVNLNVVVGNNGETMREAVLKLSRRDGALRSFSLGALVGRDGGVTGQIMNGAGGSRVMRVATTDAGALLRFINFYSRIYGGDLWLDVDPPAGDGSPQNGVINMRDFVVRGEAGLDRLIAAAPATAANGRPQPGAAITFKKLQVSFTRSAELLTLRDGVVWGPAVGSTFDGSLDSARDRISIQGTYVPAYGLNNLFSRLPVLGFFLGGGPNEGLVGVTYEVVGPLSGPTLRVNPISAVAPGFLRKIFEYRQAPDPTPPAVIPTR